MDNIGVGDKLHARHTQQEFEAPSGMDMAMPELLGPTISLPTARVVQTMPPNPIPRHSSVLLGIEILMKKICFNSFFI
jgi:hypothetical protein